MRTQRTLANFIHCVGVGLHGGTRIAMTLRPAEPDAGIVFVRTDLAGAPRIPARWDAVGATALRTEIVAASRFSSGTVSVATIEHLMAAFAGLGIDNAEVLLDGPEVPVLDGSAGDLVFLLECAGIAEQTAPVRTIRILRPVSVADGRSRAELSPAGRSEFGFEIDFPCIGRQARMFVLEDGRFKNELATSRTFGFLQDADRLRQMGLALGAGLENTVVLDGVDGRVLNEGGLRHADEFVRHKLLDAVGDLALAGAPIIGRYTGHRAGHALNNRLLRALFACETAWSWDLPSEPVEAPKVVAAA
jgi:UDP-3-O-[3-hydroxymyristoyl] N-acetylglucosamine deacetylase